MRLQWDYNGLTTQPVHVEDSRYLYGSQMKLHIEIVWSLPICTRIKISIATAVIVGNINIGNYISTMIALRWGSYIGDIALFD